MLSTPLSFFKLWNANKVNENTVLILPKNKLLWCWTQYCNLKINWNNILQYVSELTSIHKKKKEIGENKLNSRYNVYFKMSYKSKLKFKCSVEILFWKVRLKIWFQMKIDEEMYYISSSLLSPHLFLLNCWTSPLTPVEEGGGKRQILLRSTALTTYLHHAYIPRHTTCGGQ